MPCQFLFYAPTPAVSMMSCQSAGIGLKVLMFLRLDEVGMLVGWWICLYLFINDWIVSKTSEGLGCLPSNMIWFLWNQRHQEVVMTKDEVSELLWVAWYDSNMLVIHIASVVFDSKRELVLISIPNHTTLAKVHCRNRWLRVSSWVVQRIQVASQWIPLWFNSVLTSSAWCNSFHVKVRSLLGSFSLHRFCQIFGDGVIVVLGLVRFWGRSWYNNA